MAPIVKTVSKWYQAEIRCLTYLQPVLLLVLRLYFGWGFFKAGLGKLQNLESTAAYFAGLDIPLPTLNAYLAGATECFGGLLLLLGAASRLVTIPLIFTMLVAYCTQHIEELRTLWALTPDGSYNPAPFFKAAPFPYLLTALLVLLFGPGTFSIDGLLKWSLDRGGSAAGANAVPDRAPSRSDPAMHRRDVTRLALAALGGLVTGVLAGNLVRGRQKPTGDGKPGAGNTPGAGGEEMASLLLQDPHVCRGINTCKNMGKPGTTNECAGQARCATAVAHDCQGMNECKGQGGCGEHPGENDCKGQGPCAVPLSDKTWPKARKHFEELMTRAGKKLGAAPPKTG
jgi:uncharacterized membrane protein YphA (DoxX/SURF4 family)